MATSPRPAAPLTARNVSTNTPTTLLADVISYGYAAVVIWATMQFNLQFQLWQGVLLMVMFVLLRGVANEIRKDVRRQVLRDARRLATMRAQSPSRWSEEQRDGLGRRVDIGA